MTGPAAGPENQLADAAAPGWFGKLSTLGDFASRRVPEAARAVLDGWLSQVLQGSRQQLGEAWLERYLAAPLQRFVFGPGVVDGGWWFGVLMPSCDNVGRYFPLVVLQRRGAPPLDGAGLGHLDLWWRHAGEAMLETLSDGVDVERFEVALAALPPWPAASELAASAATVAAAAAAAVQGVDAEWAMPPGCSAGELAKGLAAAAWLQRLGGCCLWWSWRPQEGDTRCRVITGLPSAPLFAAMLAEQG